MFWEPTNPERPSTTVFAADWFIETKERLVEHLRPEQFPDQGGDLTCQIVPSGPGFRDENNLRLFNTLIYGAQHRLSITSPYFVPDESLLYAITTAAQRRSPSNCSSLWATSSWSTTPSAPTTDPSSRLASGSTSTPDRLCCTPNTSPSTTTPRSSAPPTWTSCSFNLDFEISMMCTGSRPFIGRMREVEDLYRSLPHEMTLTEWNTRPITKRWLDNVMRLTSAVQ